MSGRRAEAHRRRPWGGYSLKTYEADLVVVGAGLAGLTAVRSLAERGHRVILLADHMPSASGRSGGNFRAPGHGYPAEDHFLDTVKGGGYLSQRSMVRALAEEAQELRETIQGLHLQLETTPVGFRVAGAEPGAALVRALSANLPDTVHHLSGMAWEAVTTPDGRVAGLLAWSEETADWLLVQARSVIIATGGAAGVYRYTDSSSDATGDGLALAFRAGAFLADMEFVQFWPLTGIPGSSEPALGIIETTCLSPEFLARGRLLTSRGQDITEELGLAGLADGTTDPGRLARLAYQEALPGETVEHPLSLVADGDTGTSGTPLRVIPAAHHTIGGVVAGDHGQTRVEGLYVAGEAGVGVHGASRISGNGLTEALITGSRAARLASDLLEDYPAPRGTGEPSTRSLEQLARESVRRTLAEVDARSSTLDPAEARRRVGEAMWRHAALVRTRDSLDAAQSEINKIKRSLPFSVDTGDGGEMRSALKALNALLIAETMARSARYRRESRGVHHRSDYPEADPTEGLRHVRVKLISGEVSLDLSQGLDLMEP